MTKSCRRQRRQHTDRQTNNTMIPKCVLVLWLGTCQPSFPSSVKCFFIFVVQKPTKTKFTQTGTKDGDNEKEKEYTYFTISG